MAKSTTARKRAQTQPFSKFMSKVMEPVPPVCPIDAAREEWADSMWHTLSTSAKFSWALHLKRYVEGAN